jgi:hypothetical protein
MLIYKTPMVFANFSPGFEREPWDYKLKGNLTLKGFELRGTFQGFYSFSGFDPQG